MTSKITTKTEAKNTPKLNGKGAGEILEIEATELCWSKRWHHFLNETKPPPETASPDPLETYITTPRVHFRVQAQDNQQALPLKLTRCQSAEKQKNHWY